MLPASKSAAIAAARSAAVHAQQDAGHQREDEQLDGSRPPTVPRRALRQPLAGRRSGTPAGPPDGADRSGHASAGGTSAWGTEPFRKIRDIIAAARAPAASPPWLGVAGQSRGVFMTRDETLPFGLSGREPRRRGSTLGRPQVEPCRGPGPAAGPRGPRRRDGRHAGQLTPRCVCDRLAELPLRPVGPQHGPGRRARSPRCGTSPVPRAARSCWSGASSRPATRTARSASSGA